MSRISISGPPAAGKSTLWSDLRQAIGPAAAYVPDLPRLALETLDPRLSAWRDPLFQHYVGYRQLFEEAREADLMICDKSLIDAVAYWDVLFGGERPSWASEASRKRYALVLICEHHGIDADIETVQGVHADFRDQLAEKIGEVASHSPTRLVRLVGDPHQRLRQALAEIRSVA
jgi:nicotinamide riboside kinase